MLNDFFEHVVRIVYTHGGDIIKFAGDAVTVIWHVDASADGYCTSMEEAASRASQCAVALQDGLHNFEAIGGADPVLLTLHIGVGCGKMTCMHVGGVFNRWEYVVSGEAMAEIALAEPLAKSGETVVSQRVWSLIEPQGFTATSIADLGRGDGLSTAGGCRRIDLSTSPLPLRALPPPPARHPKHVDFLRRYIPRACHEALDRGLDEYISEVKTVSIVFINIQGVKLAEDHYVSDKPESCISVTRTGQELMLQVQHAVYLYEGSINKMTDDDKGLSILAVFGLKPFIHDDDPLRAVRAAKAVVDGLTKTIPDCRVTVGVTTGDTYCGLVGSKQRREYTVMGPMVNLAARLMCSAPGNSVLVDVRTRELASDSGDTETSGFTFKEMEPLILKGIAEPTRNFQSLKFSAENKKSKSASLALDFREKERSIIEKYLTRNQTGGVLLVITGDRGSGKTAVCEAAAQLGTSLGYNVYTAEKQEKKKEASEMRQNHETPKFATWAPVYDELIKYGSKDEGKSPEDFIRGILGDEQAHLALLTIVLPSLKFELPPQNGVASGATTVEDNLEQDISKKKYWDLQIDERVALLVEMLLKILESAARENPTLVVVHVMKGGGQRYRGEGSAYVDDSESWVLANQINDKLCLAPTAPNQFILCLSNRPAAYSSPEGFVRIERSAREHNTLITLNPLSKADRRLYLARLLKATEETLPEPLVEYMSNLGAGNPKHIEELQKALEKCGAYTVVKRHVVLSDKMKEEGAFDRVEVPVKTYYAAKTGVENIQEMHRLVVKFASTWDVFSEKMLVEVLELANIPSLKADLSNILNDLADSGILEQCPAPAEVLDLHPSGTGECYTFVSKLVKMQANSLLLARDKDAITAKISEMQKARDARAKEVTTAAGLSVQSKLLLWLNEDRSQPFQEAGVLPDRRAGFRVARGSRTVPSAEVANDSRRWHNENTADKRMLDADVMPQQQKSVSSDHVVGSAKSGLTRKNLPRTPLVRRNLPSAPRRLSAPGVTGGDSSSETLPGVPCVSLEICQNSRCSAEARLEALELRLADEIELRSDLAERLKSQEQVTKGLLTRLNKTEAVIAELMQRPESAPPSATSSIRGEVEVMEERSTKKFLGVWKKKNKSTGKSTVC